MTEEHLMWFTGGLCAVFCCTFSSTDYCVPEPPFPRFTFVSDAAAVDTTTQTILNFVLAMVLHPEVQKKAQDEIDSVVGTDRLPNINEWVHTSFSATWTSLWNEFRRARFGTR
jgi:hypothetical protein